MNLTKEDRDFADTTTTPVCSFCKISGFRQVAKRVWNKIKNAQEII
jgi:hypothetical protein